MKKSILLPILACVLLLVGCASTPDDMADSESSTNTVGSSADSVGASVTELVTESDAPEAPETLEETSPETLPETLPETIPETIPETEPAPAVQYQTVRNPIVDSASDPWVVEHDGHYYYCRSFWYYVSGIIVTEVPSPYELTNEGGEVVYTAPEGTMYTSNYWAPELHYLNGEWYIYFAADDGNNENHRMYVLKGTSQDPTDPFEMVGQITDPSDRWAIDGTVLSVRDELYFVWSGWKGTENVAQNIYIAHMSDPCTIDSERVLLSEPTYDWERVGTPYVNEGAAALYHGDDVFLVYSASGSWTDSYCMGLLTLVGDDPMDPTSWEKSTEPVFSSCEGLAYGPGHCSFVTAMNGSIWMIYHANLESGTGWEGRSGWIAPVTFREDGTPHFGSPRRNVRFPIALLPNP